ncbi:hypothetical protein CC53_gp179 [Rhizobium phage vB_RleS_L338C]|uniref:hypothetical protein n=1 Tax=Rhizobium phage vB_RleS_L338C TaxID=1414737 RepID=UPI0003D854C5|nr:hypothetical protein CC53_gp179 [Rhizobium phage vB_RleS_L338C]AHC30596.1 hypothetical protein L338C_179 [Rhizobium phage vB_RleS_L338C]
MIYALECSRSRIRQLGDESERYRLRWHDTIDERNAIKKSKDETECQLYEQMDTTIGALYNSAMNMPETSRWSYAMVAVRALEIMIAEFHQANPDLRQYDKAASRYGAETFYALCVCARFHPKPGDTSYVLYRKGIDYSDSENAYEYRDIHDTIVDEIFPD